MGRAGLRARPGGLTRLAMDYVVETFRDLLYLVRNGRRDVLAELLRSTWLYAAMLTALFSVAFYIFYGGDPRYYAVAAAFALILPSVTVGVALLDFLMPARFGRAVVGELRSIQREFTGSAWSQFASLYLPELGREQRYRLRYAPDVEAMVGRRYLVLLHPRLDGHALVLFDDDLNYMEGGLDYLAPELREELWERAAEFRSAARVQ
ncbi:hypothetical protein [Methylopila sp. M107]|uniref:hypothetical protein n=1 Tax=Methylopila sp. M107 TaxID=1101190 RepID=UPI00035F4999|nr:hypothetical protein [Methylopila sp. M107]